MIKDINEIQLELSINEGFEVRIIDGYTAEIQGEFDKDQIIETVKEWNEDPEKICNDKRLQEYCETWAEENGYAIPEENL